jgi:hypothetical protein
MAAIAVGLIVKGVDIARFEWSAQGRSAVEPAIAEASFDVLGMRGAARRSLAPADNFEAASKQAIENVLQIEPTNGLYWVGLAEALQDEGAAPASVLAAVQMSAATQPREAATMATRATFLLSIWETLPQSYQRLAIANLAQLGSHLPAVEQNRIRDIVAAKPEETRKAMRDALLEKTGGDGGLPPLFGL